MGITPSWCCVPPEILAISARRTKGEQWGSRTNLSLQSCLRPIGGSCPWMLSHWMQAALGIQGEEAGPPAAQFECLGGASGLGSI